MRSSTRARSAHGVGLKAGLLAAFACALLAAVPSASGLTVFSATASISPHVQYLNDPTGVVYTVTVNNTGTISLGSMQVRRPSSQWSIIGCFGAPAGWRAYRGADRCSFQSARTTSDDIQPGHSATFSFKAWTRRGSRDATGAWPVTVGKLNHFEGRNGTKATPSWAGALTTTAHSFEIRDAVVASSSSTPGTACPSPSKSAISGSTQTIVVCGKNRSTVALTPTAAQSSLGGTFISSSGSFSSGSIAANSASSVVLGNWSGATITNVAGPGKTVIPKIGASATQTSPATTLNGYEALNHAPVANNDGPYSVPEDGAIAPPAPGVLGNDTDADGDSLTASLVSGPAHAASFSLSADGSFSYAPVANYNGPDSFTYKANDGHADSNVATASIDVSAVNDAPVNSVPGAQSTSEDTPLVFSSANSNAISTSDVDAGSSDVQLTLAASHGTLTLSGTSGLVFTTGGGTNDASMVFTGTLANVNTALAGLSYAPAANYNGPDAVSLTTNDQGNTGSGGPQSDTDSVAVTVNAVNDAPVNTVPGAQSTAENTVLVFAPGNGNAITTADVDAGSSPVKVTLGVGHGTLTLGSTTGLTFATGTGTDDASMVFTGTLGDVNGAFNAMGYTPDSGYSGPDSLSLTVDDQGATGSGGALSDTDSVAITVNALNSAPVNTVPGPQSTNEDTALVFSSGNGNAISTSDADAGASPLEITLSATHGTLTLSGTTGLSFTSGDGTNDASMVFTGSIADINPALDGLTYAPDANYNGPAGITITTNDQGATGGGGPQSDTDTVPITVDAVNDAPVNSVPGPQSVNEDTALVFSSGNGNEISTSDVDVGAGDVKITLSSTHGTLTLSGTTGLVFTTGGGTNDASMVFTGTLAHVNTALAGLSYAPPANYNGPAEVSLTTDDQGQTGSGGAQSDTDTVAVTVDAVNDGPVNTVPGDQTVITNSSLVFSIGNGNAISTSDVDADPDGVQVSLSSTHGTLTLSQTTGLAFTTGDGTADASMVFTGTLASVNAALAGLTYTPDTNYDGPASLSLTTDDQGHNGSGGALSDTDSVAITVVNPPPVATNDSFGTAVGNTTFGVGTSSSGPAVTVAGTVLSNDSDADGESLSAGPASITSTHGGSVDMNSDGTFTYLPPAGFTGSDTFDYTVSDAHGSDTGTVTIAVLDMVWYVNNTNASAGDGRSTNPFKSLSSLQGGSDPDGPGDIIFVYTGAGPYGSGIPLEANQKLLGEKAGLTVSGHALVPAGATNPVITNAAGNGIALASGTDVEGVSVLGPSSSGIAGTGVSSATVGTTTPVTVSSAGGDGIHLDGGSGTIDVAASVSGSAGHSVFVANRSGGTTSLSGSIVDSGTGIRLATNTGATINLTGGITATTGLSPAFTATGGGTVNVTGAGNTLTTTTGMAFNISNTTIGSSGVTFRSIASNGATNGILLNTTGGAGGLTVTGTGAPASGGTIQNSTNSGIQATSTKNLSLSSMSVLNNGNAVNEGGIRLTDVTGSGSIAGTTVSGSAEDGIYLRNDVSTGTTFLIHGPGCSITNNSATIGNDGVNVLAATSANLGVTVDGCSFSGNRTIAVHADSGDSSTLTATITNNTITRGTPNAGNQGIEVSDAGNGNVTFDVSNNSVGTVGAGLLNTGINVFNGSAGNAVMAGKVVGNSVFNDATVAPAASNGFGIRVFNSNLAAIRAKVTGNTVKNVNTDYGILAESSGTAAPPSGTHGRLDVEVSSNNVDVASSALDAIRVQGRNFSTACAKVAGNTTDAGGTGFFGIFLRQANSAVFDYEDSLGTLAFQNPAAASTSTFGTITSVGAGTCNFAGIP